jgi:hypothetical protein
VLSLELRKSKQKIEGQKRGFGEQSFSPCRDKNEWKPWEISELKQGSSPIYHSFICKSLEHKIYDYPHKSTAHEMF